MFNYILMDSGTFEWGCEIFLSSKKSSLLLLLFYFGRKINIKES
jgi:hypothetical protein